MDFHNVLSIASEKQGLSSLTKRYSLQPGPPKRDPKVKGVNSSAVQAFLKKKETEEKRKELVKKRQKDELLAKRVELKSDRKARAMASRTKDNFRGYNGIPVVEQPKKRQRKSEKGEEDNNDSYYNEDNYEYAATDSEQESEPESEPESIPESIPASIPARPQERSFAPTKMSSVQKKPSAPPKAAPSHMNFADLIKLAEKKQFEPVELKPIKKTEEKLRTAEEIKEFELEHKIRKKDNGRDSKTDKSSGKKDSKHGTNFHKKNGTDREIREGKSPKSSNERLTSGISKTSKPSSQSDQSAKLSHGDRSKPSSNSKSALSGKAAIKGSPASVKQALPRPQSAGKPTNLSDLSSRKVHPGLPQAKMNSSGSQREPAFNSSKSSGHGQSIKGSGQVRPSQNNLSKGGPTQKLGKGEVPRSSGTPPSRPSSNGQMRSVPSGSSKQAGTPQPRPGGSSQGRPVPGGAQFSTDRPSKPNRPLNGMGPGPGRPQCTVVSETISSKNFSAKPGMPPRPSAPQAPKTIIGPTGHRIFARPTVPGLPPITSSYKRRYKEEEEYDSEMDDFIDNEGEDQDEVSKHIREIFGYDRNKYKDESDYALKFMESSWRDQQKEEARSLRLGIKEDEEELHKEEEEMRRKEQFKKAKCKRT
ncbi:protein SPT2 homolog [Trichomycterus rosablanca]|uniref:protein SPT2 homolog n=1 Tax=Trichomycterus rosablanca TaxID=2290929 RepID=UPI002F35790A